MKINFSGSSVTLDAAAADSEPRISGIAAPYGVDAEVSTGQRVRIMAGALPVDGKMPRLVIEHDTSRVVGVVDMREETDAGMLFSARIADTTEGRDLIALLKMNALDSVSVGLSVQDYEMDGKTMLVKAASWEELSVVYQPAFPQAQITQIAASNPDDDEPEPNTEENPVSENNIPVEAAAAEAIPTQPLHAAAAKPFQLPSMAEYISKYFAGGSEFAEFNARIRAAAPDVTTTDTPGILPDPIVGPVYTSLIANFRPVVNAFGVRAMPAGSGKQFQIPYIQTHTTIGASNGENAALDAGQFVVDSLTVQKQVYGGYVRLSEEDMDWTQPEVLSELIDDMARKYAYATDDAVADALVTATTNTNNFTSANIADPAEWISWIYTAASDILSGTNGHLPDTIFLAPNRWASMGQLVDTADRPLFPQVGPMNAYGNVSPTSDVGNAFGLRVVVDANLASGTLLVGSTTDGAFRIFEQQKGVVSVEAADGSLSRYIKFRGYIGTGMVDATKFIKAAFV